MSGRRKQVPAPPRWMTALEGRAVGERLSMEALRPILNRMPAGDGHAVLVLPGFLADDRSTEPLRHLLDVLGYETYGWKLGTNLGPTHHIVDGLGDLIPAITDRHGPMSVVGWSLGGIFGRLIAGQSPQLVRQVVTLGSPIQMQAGDDSASSRVWNRVEHLHIPNLQAARSAATGPLRVPTTAVYTRTDGVVHWSTCLVEEGPQAENVEVYGSHCGLGFNSSAALVVADRLARPTSAWKPFRAPWYLRANYPKPAKLAERYRTAS